MSSAVARRAMPGTGQSLADSGRLSSGLSVSKENQSFIKERLELFESLFKSQQDTLASKPEEPIVITLPDGATKPGLRFRTTPRDIALSISKGLAESVVVAKVTFDKAEEKTIVIAVADEDDAEPSGCCSCGDASELWDMTRPLEGSCKLEFLKFDSPEGQNVFWHSSAHILGESLENEFGAHLTIGPPLERGFYYDSYLGPDMKISDEKYSVIQAQAEKAIKEDQPFQRLVLSKEKALELFKANPFKCALISSKVPDGAVTSVYKCGTLVDLCRGPHLPSTGKVKAFSVEKHSSVYWLGVAGNDDLQRVYAISFPDAKLMKQYKTMVEEAKKRDHRVVGGAMNLFFFDAQMSPGSCFWLPEGARVYNKLTDFIRGEYRIRGFSEVLSPNIFSCDVFKVSGHYQNYKENMYCFDVEGKEWALKPMNCPGHCLMFRHMNPSYRQLPIRMADFGVLHRNEASGSLTGLLRVRRFQQDDAHIFCRMDQVEEEVKAALEFLFFVYGIFGFKFDLKLSTRPKKALGSVELWQQAEAALASALEQCGQPWAINAGDGAFYGPKIDIRVQDALQRWHQCGTVQLDFQLPLRFNLQYRTADEVRKGENDEAAVVEPKAVEPKTVAPAGAAAAGSAETLETTNDVEGSKGDGSWETRVKAGYARPVMVHRAILGSIERMSAVLVEHTGGKFPFWLSPRQICVCPISEKNLEYARYVADILKSYNFDVSVDESNNTVNKKIRQAQVDRWNYALVVGQAEQDSSTVTVRNRDDPNNQQLLSLDAVVELFKSLGVPNSRKEIKPFKPQQ